MCGIVEKYRGNWDFFPYTVVERLIKYDLMHSFRVNMEAGMARGESACLPPMRPGFDPGPLPHVSYVCGWLFYEAFSPGSAILLPPQKNNTSKFQFGQDKESANADVASSVNIVI